LIIISCQQQAYLLQQVNLLAKLKLEDTPCLSPTILIKLLNVGITAIKFLYAVFY
jgi:hypothetical protein